MIRPRYLPGSIVARKVSASAFLHSLGQLETFPALSRMSAAEGKADILVPRDSRIPSGTAGSPFGSGERPVGRDQYLAAAGLAAGMIESRLDVLQAIGRLDIYMEAAVGDARHQVTIERGDPHLR